VNDLTEESVAKAAGSWAPMVRLFDTIDSTNRVAAEWASEGAPHGSLVLADHQSAGRGRLDRTWHSESGTSLLLSLILDPQQLNAEPSFANAEIALALCNALIDRGIEARIKWPNDVIIDERKIAGILSELITTDAGLPRVVVGLGVNVNNQEFPADIAATATSLAIVKGKRVDRAELLEDLLAALQALPTKGSVKSQFENLCATLGRKVKIQTAEDVFVEGIATGIDDRGGLVLSDGSVYYIGDVLHLRVD
jgi:BirA family biotin operon repressor/biotin-[acetyl-CoA-carboxylase] ligase